MGPPLAYARSPEVRSRWLAQLAELLAIPSVSADPGRRGDVAAAAAWLVSHLGRIGMARAQVLPGAAGGAPSVYAEWLGAPGRPTLLVYGHFDVQPPGDARRWRTPPFRPTVLGQQLSARGASDDKGQLFAHLAAAECWLRAAGGLPVNLKVWLEGEEEVGSPTIEALLDREAGRLAADAVLISDTEMSAGRPSIIYGLRGSLVCDVELRGPPRSLHSGRFGGAAPNPAQALAALVAGLHGPGGRVAVRGFYDRVRPLGPAERAALRRDGRSDAALLALIGRAGEGEPGYTLFERTAARPALNVTGLAAGAVGPRATSSIPAAAAARLNCRLVPDQSPREVAGMLRAHLRARVPPGSQLRLRFSGAVEPALLPRGGRAVAAAARAVEQVWEVPPAYTRSGGSIGPVVALRRRLGAPVVLLGFALPEDMAHAPDERFSIPTLFRAVETSVRLLAEYAR